MTAASSSARHRTMMINTTHAVAVQTAQGTVIASGPKTITVEWSNGVVERSHPTYRNYGRSVERLKT